MPVVHISFSDCKTFTLSGKVACPSGGQPSSIQFFFHKILQLWSLVYICICSILPFPVPSLHLNACCFLHTTHLFICTTSDSESENIYIIFLRQHPALNNCTLSCLFLSVVKVSTAGPGKNPATRQVYVEL